MKMTSYEIVVYSLTLMAALKSIKSCKLQNKCKGLISSDLYTNKVVLVSFEVYSIESEVDIGI